MLDKWNPEFGILPTAETSGLSLDYRSTCIDQCPTCPGLASFYEDTGELCVEQTNAIHEAMQTLLEALDAYHMATDKMLEVTPDPDNLPPGLIGFTMYRMN